MNALSLQLTQAELSLLEDYLDNYTMIQVIGTPQAVGERWLKIYHEHRLPLIIKLKESNNG